MLQLKYSRTPKTERPEDIDAAVAADTAAGGAIVSQGAFGPGLPYAFVRGPDGYEIEIWYE